jgi:hypothetical protein
LGSGATPSSASVSEEELQNFQDSYGHSAFTCRYAHFERASDGFGSHQEREKHEAQHRREYRCATPTCAYSEMGFASRAQLNRHTRKYHAQFDDETSFADEVRALKKRRAAEEITKHKKTSSVSVREISPQFSSESSLSVSPRSSPELGSPSAQFANQSKISPFPNSRADGANQYENTTRGFPDIPADSTSVIEKMMQNLREANTPWNIPRVNTWSTSKPQND